MSDLQPAVSTVLENDYVTLVIFTAVAYDYILTFSDEIEYVWNKPWTRISTLFIFIRYCSLCIVITYVLVGSTFLPGPAKAYVFIIRFLLTDPRIFLRSTVVSQMLYTFGQWATVAFLAAADLTAVAMVLRVWTIYMRSKIVLGILLTLYMGEVIPLVIEGTLVSVKFPANTDRVLDFLFCVTQNNAPTLGEVADSLGFALAVAMFFLVANKFVRNSLEIYKDTKQWDPSPYMDLFAKEGVLYFLAVLLLCAIDILSLGVKMPSTGWRALALAILQYVPVFTLAPRFILSVRALYARRCGPFGMDTEFGLGIITAPFADAERGKDVLVEIRTTTMEEGGTRNVGSAV